MEKKIYKFVLMLLRFQRFFIGNIVLLVLNHENRSVLSDDFICDIRSHLLISGTLKCPTALPNNLHN